MLAWLALLAAALFFIPIPYFIFGPGAAVDLARAVIVPGHTSPPGKFYLTDVNLLPGRPFFYIAAKALPGFEIVRRGELAPPNVSDKDLDRELVDAMRESQVNAQIVAEREAGLPVKSASNFIVLKTIPGSPAARCFRRDDRIFAVDGRMLRDAGTLAQATSVKRPGTRFVLTLTRNGKRRIVACSTFRYKGKARFGVTGSFKTEVYSLPVHVQYQLPNINGSSAGLMFALQIYRTITGRNIAAGRSVAGTGVLTSDGAVQPVEGAKEKVRAAMRAQADIFFVPKDNYNDIRHTTGIRVIPVKNFHEALHALQKSY